jgi:NTE family protein
VGEIAQPAIPLAVAVAASCALPPFLSPLVLECDPASFTPGSGAGLQHPPYTAKVLLAGGVDDSLGLETAWKAYRTVLVSDGGGQLLARPRPGLAWPRQSLRALDLLDHQVRGLRKRQVVNAYKLGLRHGTYWGVGSDASAYGLVEALDCPAGRTRRLACIPTRLRALPPTVREQLVNWGYAICDIAMRRWVDPALPAPAGFPYPRAGVG